VSVFHTHPCCVFILMYPFSSAYCSRTLSGSSLRKDANVVAGTASLQVRKEEGGWNQPGSLDDVVSFSLRWTTCIFVLLALYYICIYRANPDACMGTRSEMTSS
jgi:hypothetical protein